jgi:hypothetical protein
MELTNEQLARECNRFAGLIESRSRRTKAGDEIRALLIACGNRILWMRPGYQEAGTCSPSPQADDAE